ncbi:MAG: hypothetical protein QM783_02730 [Phycisphaerales bacterium]
MFASRFALTLSALGLLAASGVMAAAGPDNNKRNDLSVRVEIGDRDHGWHGRPGWGRPPRPVVIAPPVVVAPAPVIVTRPVIVAPAPVIAEVSPRTLDVQAFQAGDTVMILARGENITSGFTTSLERESDWRRDGMTRVTLHNVGPINCAAQVCTPFAISGGFETRERLSELHLNIAGEDRCIQVQQIARIN